MTAQKKGIVLINVGSPNSTAVSDVRRYLREFLSDPRMLDINPLFRWLLVHLLILPFRSPKSAHAYAKIWTSNGSPLVHFTMSLAKKLEAILGSHYLVRAAMRYGSPSIPLVIDELQAKGVDSLILVPMFPQYSSAATGSAVNACYEHLGRKWNVTPTRVIPAFFNHPNFISAQARNIREKDLDFKSDFILFSYHGLPERHCQKSVDDKSYPCCRSEGCCNKVTDKNAHCYRAQCFATSRALAAELGLKPEQWSISFQSRLGRSPWVKPYTDLELPKLAAQGVKRLLVSCPSFVTDCLETLEEIGIRARHDFIKAGGHDLALVPALNDSPHWAEALVEICQLQG